MYWIFMCYFSNYQCLFFFPVQYYPSLNRSRCCLKSICTGDIIQQLSQMIYVVISICLQFDQSSSTRVFSTDESSQFNSSYTVSFIINAMPFPFSIPILLSCLTVVRCPFCKTANYAVEYRGEKTKKEKELELSVRINLHILASFLFFGV